MPIVMFSSRVSFAFASHPLPLFSLHHTYSRSYYETITEVSSCWAPGVITCLALMIAHVSTKATIFDFFKTSVVAFIYVKSQCIHVRVHRGDRIQYWWFNFLLIRSRDELLRRRLRRRRAHRRRAHRPRRRQEDGRAPRLCPEVVPAGADARCLRVLPHLNPSDTLRNQHWYLM